jgi:hypothetical protein
MCSKLGLQAPRRRSNSPRAKANKATLEGTPEQAGAKKIEESGKE